MESGTMKEELTAAMKEGISGDAIAQEFNERLNDANTKEGKKRLKFLVRLISKFKRNEKKLQSQQTNEAQIYIKR